MADEARRTSNPQDALLRDAVLAIAMEGVSLSPVVFLHRYFEAQNIAPTANSLGIVDGPTRQAVRNSLPLLLLAAHVTDNARKTELVGAAESAVATSMEPGSSTLDVIRGVCAALHHVEGVDASFFEALAMENVCRAYKLLSGDPEHSCHKLLPSTLLF